MNRRIGIVLSMLLIAGSFTLYGAQSSGQMERKAIKLPNKFVNAPFSDGIVFGDTLYLAGRIGIDPKTGKVIEYPFPHAELAIREFFRDSQGRMWYGTAPNNKVGYFYLTRRSDHAANRNQ